MNRIKKFIVFLFPLVSFSGIATAGGNLIQVDPSDSAQVIERKWDERMMPISWVLSEDGIPESAISNADIVNEFTAAFDTWQSISTSAISFSYEGEVARRKSGLGGALSNGIDGYNLVTFTDPDVVFPPGVVGLAMTFSFSADVVIDETNNDIDGDGFQDVPNGLYVRGTIFDGDIIFNSSLNYSTSGANSTLDIRAIALHEVGHFFGLSHSSIDAAVMYPFLSTDTAQARTLHADDIGYTSLFYPEEPAYSSTLGTITGNISSGFDGAGILGAHVYAVDIASGEKRVGAYSLIDGSYVIPVAEGSYYVGIEPLDGDPAALDPARINGVIAFTLDTAFSEELYDANEASIETDPLAAIPVIVTAGGVTSGIDLITNTLSVPGISRVLLPGINYMSYPVVVPIGLTAFDLLSVLGDSSEMVSIDWFNPVTSLFERAIYESDNPAGSNFFIKRGEGYLVHSKVQKVVTFTGVADCPTINVFVGFNLIGVPCPPSGFGAYDLLKSLGNEFEVLSVQRYEKSSDTFEIVTFNGQEPMGVDFNVVNGEAYIAEMAVAKSTVKVPGQGQIFPPSITGISPGRAVPGSTVLIVGEGFDVDTVDNLVVFNGVGASVAFATPNSLTVVVPANAVSGSVTVTIDGKQSNSVFFLVEDLIITENPDGDTELITGQTAQGIISLEGEKDRYTFIALKDSKVTVSADSVITGSPDLMLVLEGPSGVVLISDDDGGDGSNALINNYRLPETGIYTIVVTSVSGTGEYLLALDVKTNTTTPQISALGGGIQTGLAGTPLPNPFEVLVTGSNGMPLAGVPVSFVAADIEFVAGLSLNAGTTTITTNSNGLATVNATLPNSAGEFEVTVSIVGLPGASPVTLEVGSTSTLITNVEVTGNDQDCGGGGCTVGQPLPNSYQIRYLDIDGEPVEHVKTHWALVSGGGSISGATTHTTSSDGISTVTHTMGTQLYIDDSTVRVPQAVAATVPGQAAPVLFASLARADVANNITQNRTDFSQITYNTASLNAIHITVTDQYDNPVENEGISVSSSVLSVQPGLYKGVNLSDFKTDEEGVWVGRVTAVAVIPTIDEFGDDGTQGLASTYSFSVSAGSATVSYNVDVDMGPTMVTGSMQGDSKLITKVLDNPVRKIVFRYQRRDEYLPGANDDDDDEGIWTDEEDFTPSNLRYIPIEGVDIVFSSIRGDGEEEDSDTATKLNGQSTATFTTDAFGLTPANLEVTMSSIGGETLVLGEIFDPILVEFEHDELFPGQTGVLFTSELFKAEDNYREFTSILAIPVVITINLDDLQGTPDPVVDPYPGLSNVSGIALSSLDIQLNGLPLFVDGLPYALNKFPHQIQLFFNGVEQKQWPTSSVIEQVGLNSFKLVYEAIGGQLSTSNTVVISNSYKDKSDNIHTNSVNPEFTFNF